MTELVGHAPVFVLPLFYMNLIIYIKELPASIIVHHAALCWCRSLTAASRGQNGICTIIGAHMKVKGYFFFENRSQGLVRNTYKNRQSSQQFNFEAKIYVY